MRNKDTIKRVIVYLVILLLGIFLGILCTKNKKTENTKEIVEDTTEKKEITTYAYDHKKLDNEQAQTVKNQILEKLNTLKHSNILMEFEVGESVYEGFLYNEHGEAFSQLSDGSYATVHKNNGDTVTYNSEQNTLGIGQDLDYLTLAENAIKLLDSSINNVTLYEMVLDNSSTKEYRLDVKGDNNVKGIYDSLGDDYANYMTDSFKEQLDNEELHFIFVYILEEDSISLNCMYVHDDTENINWAVNGYSDIKPWKLDDKWYSINTSDDNENGVEDTEIETLFDELVAQLDNEVL